MAGLPRSGEPTRRVSIFQRISTPEADKKNVDRKKAFSTPMVSSIADAGEYYPCLHHAKTPSKHKHIAFSADVGVITHPLESDLEQNPSLYAPLSEPSKHNVACKVQRRHDGTDDEIFIIIG